MLPYALCPLPPSPITVFLKSALSWYECWCWRLSQAQGLGKEMWGAWGSAEVGAICVGRLEGMRALKAPVTDGLLDYYGPHSAPGHRLSGNLSVPFKWLRVSSGQLGGRGWHPCLEKLAFLFPHRPLSPGGGPAAIAGGPVDVPAT